MSKNTIVLSCFICLFKFSRFEFGYKMGSSMRGVGCCILGTKTACMHFGGLLIMHLRLDTGQEA